MTVNVSAHGLPAKRKSIVGRSLRWWDLARRDLAWRAGPEETPDPYRVWLSEVLLQQTTTQAATPYYLDFVARWPTVQDLAAAPADAVISAFAGLGYYSRARNLHACAKEIVRRGGRFPEDETALRTLPGIGVYTAAAVAAIAFGRPTVPVDGNIARIVSRLLAIDQPVAAAGNAIAAAARALAPIDRPGDFAQALMDLGALICRPQKPNCAECPLSDDCLAFRSGAPQAFPRRRPATAKQDREGAVFFASDLAGAFLARRRPQSGLLASTVELPGTPWTKAGEPIDWRVFVPVSARWRRLPETIQQAFTHFALTLTVYAATFEGEAPNPCFWVTPEKVGEAGFSSVMRKAVSRALMSR
jgi:A/G-specific adenine glycosylase